ncbi:ATP-binding protein [Brevibacillus sp. SYSU BS000544]|uniref:ATP-binding protein n=1 Tax=Brevibacillus sp. SYSU BS000544 TaxID=3416443 RepID=UPI003CE58F37
MAGLLEKKELVPSEQAYANSSEHLQDELKRLGLLLQIQIAKELERQPDSVLGPFMGLVVSDEQIRKMLEDFKNPMAEESPLAFTNEKIQKLYQALEKIDAEITTRRAASLRDGVYLALPYLSQVFRLTRFDEQCILICLAPEMDRNYEKVYSYLQDDVTRKKPSVDLVLKLLCPIRQERLAARLVFDSQAPLIKYGLLHTSDYEPGSPSTLLSRFLKLDERIVNFLLGFNQMEHHLDSIARLVQPQEEYRGLLLANDHHSRISDFIQSYLNHPEKNRESILFAFYGPDGSGREALARAVCQDHGFPIIIADVERMLESEQSFKQIILLLCREAVLLPAALCFTNVDHLLTNDGKYKNQLKLLLEWTQNFSRLTFLIGNQSWNSLGIKYEHFFIELEFSIPDDGLRKSVWDSFRGKYQFDDQVDFGALSGKFRFTPGQIENALIKARNLTRWRSPENERITEADLHSACRSQSSQKLGILGNRVKSDYTWNDMILPPDQMNQLREIINQVKYRNVVFGDWGFQRKISRGKGLNVLFSGPPGTGKTMAAEVIANELHLDLYKIDLSQVVNKYIGETEKNLNRVFEGAQASYAILFFDEADVLFGKRSEVKDAHDRYANTEIAYLLQKMEEYEGITILATNLYKNIDEAYVRRLQFHVPFPIPDEENRYRIWRTMFPNEAPKREIDFGFLARQFQFSGGNIKNVVLTAAFLAAEDSGVIEMKHVIRAIKYELQKIGKLCLQNDFGPYNEYVR